MVKTRDELTYCGLDCEKCDIYQATVFGQTLKPEAFHRWQEDIRKYWKIEVADPKQLKCHGCRYEGSDDFYTFKLCPIRNCCMKRRLTSCGLCTEFKTCKRHDIQEAKDNLERLAATD